MISAGGLLRSYNTAKAKHPDLADARAADLRALDAAHSVDVRSHLTHMMIILFGALPLILFVGLICAGAALDLERMVTDALSPRIADGRFAPSPAFQAASLFAATAAIGYFWLPPALSCLYARSRLLRSRRLGPVRPHLVFVVAMCDLDYRSTRYWRAALVATWATIALYPLCMPIPRRTLDIGIMIWLQPLTAAAALFPILGLTSLVALMIRARTTRQRTTYIEVLVRLLGNLESWPGTAVTDVGLGELRIQARRIARTSRVLRRLYVFGTAANQSEEWIASKLRRAADRLLECASWLSLPDPHRIESARARLVEYSNAFLTGDLRSLLSEEAPAREILETARRPRPLRTALSAAAILAYCMAPLIALVFLRSAASSPIPDGVGVLAYSLWITIGVYVYLESTAQGAASTAIDLVKSLISK